MSTDSDNHRCLAHIVHLAAKHIVQAFSRDGPAMDPDFPTDSTDTSPADLDEDSETSYAPGDTLGKLWAFINQVRVCCVRDRLLPLLWWAGGQESVHAALGQDTSNLLQVRLSPQASAFFFRCCAEEKLPRLELVKYVRTRWSSMYDLLERAFKLKDVSYQFFLLLY